MKRTLRVFHLFSTTSTRSMDSLRRLIVCLKIRQYQNIESLVDNSADLHTKEFTTKNKSLMNSAGSLLTEDTANALKEIPNGFTPLVPKLKLFLTMETFSKLEILLSQGSSLLSEKFVKETKGLISGASRPPGRLLVVSRRSYRPSLLWCPNLLRSSSLIPSTNWRCSEPHQTCSYLRLPTKQIVLSRMPIPCLLLTLSRV